MAHGAETILWGLGATAVAGWASFVSWGSVLSWINRAKTRAIFGELNQIKQDMKDDRQEMKDAMKGIVEDHKQSQQEFRTQINQLIQGGR